MFPFAVEVGRKHVMQQFNEVDSGFHKFAAFGLVHSRLFYQTTTISFNDLVQ